MSESYWRAVVEAGMYVPTDRPLDEVTTELVEMLASPDPGVRDDMAFPLLATWLRDGQYDELLRGFGDGIVPGLSNGLGNDGDDSVLRRSFTALVLAEAVARDNDEQILDTATVLAWGDAATSWYVRERDLRGWVPERGWAHAVAHGADLLGVLARSRHFGPLELTVLLDVVGDRLLAPTHYAWRHGDEDRLAYAVMAILHRDALGADVVEPWLSRLGAGVRSPRTHERTHAEWPSPAAHNTSRFLRALYIQLALGVQGRSDLRHDGSLFAQPPKHRADLMLAVLDQVRAESPWLFQAGGGRRAERPA